MTPQSVTTHCTPRPYHWQYDGRIAALPAENALRALMRELVLRIDMTPIFPLDLHIDEASGLAAAMQVIAESHIALHVYQHRYVVVDVFSCKLFDYYAVLDVLSEHLGGSWTSRALRTPEVLGEGPSSRG